MGKSRARVPSYYRQSIQNAVNWQINLGRTKTAASLSREAVGQVVSYCFVAAAHDILNFDAGQAAVLTVKMNNAAERYTIDRDKRGMRKARIALEDRTAPLMVERFLLPAGKLGRTANEREILAERRDAADMVARYVWKPYMIWPIPWSRSLLSCGKPVQISSSSWAGPRTARW